mmetsp:Transcript_11004/g.19903  ORF Transcript_11004/g.19903 Transcript_11004/m.19903 type:complete len:273 (-) Transcript_11004:177-995(-)
MRSFHPIEHSPNSESDAAASRIGQDLDDFVAEHGHSHNDYCQDAPITSALANGLKSLEVDVFPGPEDSCLVAHTKFGLTGERTLTKYIKPLLKHLDATSRHRKAVVPRVRKRDSIIKFIGRRQAGQQLRLGAKDGPIKLLIDIKRQPLSVLPLLEKNLKPLSKYLTTHDENGDIKEGLATVLLSGDVGGIAKHSLQNGIFFLDGRISDISTSKSNTTPLVSVNYRTLIYSSIIRLKSRSKMINEICEKAHDKGKKKSGFSDVLTTRKIGMKY